MCIDGDSCPKNMADLFRRYFQAKSPLEPAYAGMSDTGLPLNNSKPVGFTVKDIKTVIRNMAGGKSPGHDSLSVEHLRYAGPHLSRAVPLFYSLCIFHSYLP